MCPWILFFLILSTCAGILMSHDKPIHAYKGSVWPKPAEQNQKPTALIYDPDIFKFEVTHYNCKLIKSALSRCNKTLYILDNIAKRTRKEKITIQNSRKSPTKLTGLLITLQMPCENYPHRVMDESYYLEVSKMSQLISKSIWGIIRGLETFAQLFNLSNDNRIVFLRATTITDKPRYAHRGLMLDTSQDHFSTAGILDILDGMAINKLNVFHWRFVNFDVSAAGNYEMLFSKKEVRDIIEYAREVGIRVIPEFGLPLHAGPDPSNLNPLKTLSYDHLRDFYKDIQTLFFDQYLHLGDVDLSRWTENPEVKQYLEKHHNNMIKFHKFCLKKVQSVIKNGTIPIVWQSSNDIDANLPDDFIIQTNKKSWLVRRFELLKKGRFIISSIKLNQKDQSRIELNSFKNYYMEDPRNRLYEVTKNRELDENILGVEAILGNDLVHGYGILNSTWLHISVIAEILWSPKSEETPRETLDRIFEHICRFHRHGIIYGSCVGNDKSVIAKPLEKKKKSNRPPNNDMIEWNLLVSSLISPTNM